MVWHQYRNHNGLLAPCLKASEELTNLAEGDIIFGSLAYIGYRLKAGKRVYFVDDEIDVSISVEWKEEFLRDALEKGYELIPVGTDLYFQLKKREKYPMDIPQLFLRKYVDGHWIYIDVATNEKLWKRLSRRATRIDVLGFSIRVPHLEDLIEQYRRASSRTDIPLIKRGYYFLMYRSLIEISHLL